VCNVAHRYAWLLRRQRACSLELASEGILFTFDNDKTKSTLAPKDVRAMQWSRVGAGYQLTMQLVPSGTVALSGFRPEVSSVYDHVRCTLPFDAGACGAPTLRQVCGNATHRSSTEQQRLELGSIRFQRYVFSLFLADVAVQVRI
jgi:hypothetical protein